MIAKYSLSWFYVTATNSIVRIHFLLQYLIFFVLYLGFLYKEYMQYIQL